MPLTPAQLGNRKIWQGRGSAVDGAHGGKKSTILRSF
jgi:hypothetical protein